MGMISVTGPGQLGETRDIGTNSGRLLYPGAWRVTREAEPIHALVKMNIKDTRVGQETRNRGKVKAIRAPRIFNGPLSAHGRQKSAQGTRDAGLAIGQTLSLSRKGGSPRGTRGYERTRLNEPGWTRSCRGGQNEYK